MVPPAAWAQTLKVAFQTTDLRCFRQGDRVYFTIPDIARATGAHVRDLRLFVERNTDAWAPFVKKEVDFKPGYVTYLGAMTTPGPRIVTIPGQDGTRRQNGGQFATCTWVDDRGMVALLLKISTSRIKDPARRARVLAFQRWAIELVAAVLRDDVAAVVSLSPKGSRISSALATAQAGKKTEAVRSLAVEMHVSKSTVYRWKKREAAGLPYQFPRANKGSTWYPRERRIALDLAAQGHPLKEIAPRVPSACRRTVARWLHRAASGQ